MKKFVVYLTTYSGQLLPKFYIGSTTEKKALSGKYFGSVRSKKWRKIFIEELKNNPALFSLDILSVHNNHEDAINEELRQQLERNVVKSDVYFNEGLATVNGYFGRDTSNDKNPNYGKKMSIETRKKMSDARKGKMLSIETRKKMSDARKGKCISNEHKEKISQSLVGRVFSEESKEKMSISQMGNTNKKGKKLSNDSIEKIKEARKRQIITEEHKKHISETFRRKREERNL